MTADLPLWLPDRARSSSRWRRRRPNRSPAQFRPHGAETLFAIIPSLPRAELARLTEQMIDRLDQLDGDADFEFNGDELDGSLGEDDFHHQSANWIGYPGCPISDPPEDNHDREQEQAHD
jgi:hypothetical protein